MGAQKDQPMREGQPRLLRGEASERFGKVRQVAAASAKTNPITAALMEEVVRRENLTTALKRVRANKGSPGIDGKTVEELGDYLREQWSRIREELLRGDYQPQPVKEVKIPKLEGGSRQLGIPWVVDIDLEKFFDRVNHDILMGRLAKRIEDKRILRLIRRYLQAGVMVHGVVQERWEGTPQGGPLSPLLSNLLLDELDRELERRGHRFCRYADDGNVYVKTKRAGERVFESIERFLWKRLRLRVNRDKSAVAHYPERSFLGFSFTRGRELKIRFSAKSLRRMKGQVKAITRRSRGVSFDQVIESLNTFLRGWIGYYRLVETHTVIRDLDSWIRRRLRCFMVKRWINNCHTRYKKLVAMGVNVKDALAMAGSRRGPWALSNAKPLKVAMPNRFFAEQGLLSLLHQYETVR